jgi:hypothetical protein
MGRAKAAAGTAPAEDVATFEGARQGGCLNGKGLGDPEGVERRHEGGRHAKIAEALSAGHEELLLFM